MILTVKASTSPSHVARKMQLLLIVGLGCFLWSFFGVLSWNAETVEFADQFPSLEETLWMAKLSKIVYEFRHEDENYCNTFKLPDGTKCEMYDHNTRLGTQVLIVSNTKKRYIAVAFAGTDDIRTSLEDAHVTQKPFGNNSTITLPDKSVRVHSGFNNAIFLRGVWTLIASTIKRLVAAHPHFRVYSTGHSLGGANSVLSAVALSLEGHKVKSISFGCPQTGNKFWSEFVSKTTPMKNELAIWRVVLGWDLIPRLPDFFFHAGHTIQLWKNTTNATNVESYFEHYGSEALNYAGAPPGWSAKPHFIGPEALTSHFMTKYIDHLEELNSLDKWVHDFKRSTEPINYDDDDNLPDDWYSAE